MDSPPGMRSLRCTAMSRILGIHLLGCTVLHVCLCACGPKSWLTQTCSCAIYTATVTIKTGFSCCTCLTNKKKQKPLYNWYILYRSHSVKQFSCIYTCDNSLCSKLHHLKDITVTKFHCFNRRVKAKQDRINKGCSIKIWKKQFHIKLQQVCSLFIPH
jgi:hypothetical protein